MTTMQIYGRLDPFWETGTEGIIWALDDKRVPGYDALWPLEHGDQLRVLDLHGQTLWEGTVKLEYERNRIPIPLNPQYEQQASRGFWVHGFQHDLEPEVWADMFFMRYRAVLAPTHRQVKDLQQEHPFIGPSATTADRLLALSEERQRKLYQDAMYPWLQFFGHDDAPSGLAIREWDFTPAETGQLIGSPTVAQVEVWKHYPRRGDAMLMPYTFDGLLRVALLCGVYGGLDWKFDTKEERIVWLNAGRPSPKELLLDGRIAEVRDLIAPQLDESRKP